MENSLASAIVGHLVGDYLLQNDWMALNKKAATFACSVHCAIWATVVCLMAGWPLVVFAVLFALHFTQDRTNVVQWYMRTIGQQQFMTGPCSPWSIIVVDNVWHILSLWVTWKVLSCL